MLRSRTAAETIEAMSPHFAALGITRLARQTGLDRTGMPCFACVRPRAATLSVSQGKGLTDDQAKVSAIMEAAEFAIAERPRLSSSVNTARELRAEGRAFMVPHRLLPMGAGLPCDLPLQWVTGIGVFSKAEILVPLAAVHLSGKASELPGICQTTNGLASGNTFEEALVQGICELVERDANTLWSLKNAQSRAHTAIAIADSHDGSISSLLDRMACAGMSCSIFDQTADTDIPTFMVAVGEVGGAKTRYQIAAGFGTDIDPVLALLRAITEALQSRITAIAGARDDLCTAGFSGSIMPEDVDILLSKPTRFRSFRRLHELGPSALLELLREKFAAAGVLEPTAIDLSGDELPCKVVRVISNELEDYGANSNWRPGVRAASALLAA